jgi:hypothetical protein
MDPDHDLLQKLDRQEIVWHLLPMAVSTVVAAAIAVFCYLILKEIGHPRQAIAFDTSALVFLAAAAAMAFGVQKLG